MKILHTSDWHLGKRLESFSRLEEQKAVLEEICGIADKESVNAVIIAGDLFDSYNPPVEAVELFYKTVKKLSNNANRAVVAISGNHDSPERIQAPDPLARECGIILTGYPNIAVSKFSLESGLCITKSDNGFIEIMLPDISYPLRIITSPYANEYRLRIYLESDNKEQEINTLLKNIWKELAEKYCDNSGVNILTAHLFMFSKSGDIPEEPEDEKPILHAGGLGLVPVDTVPVSIQYVALGHLHGKKVIKTDKPFIAYSGSPLEYSMSEANQDKFVIISDIKPGSVPDNNCIKLNQGKKLVRKSFHSISEAADWLVNNPNCLVELTLISDNYLSAKDLRQIYQSHKGIVTIIPEIVNKEALENQAASSIDLSKNMEDIFIEYFKHKNKGQSPDDDLLKIFREIIDTEVES